MGDLTTPETQASLVLRLRAIHSVLVEAPETAHDAESMKFLQEAVELLDGLDDLLGMVLADEAQEDPSSTLGDLIGRAGELRDRFDRANPEPRG